MIMAEPAPQVEPANASTAPTVEPATVTSVVKPANEPANASTAPTVEPATVASMVKPANTAPADLLIENTKKSTAADEDQNPKKFGVEALRAAQQVAFEGAAAVVVGPVEKDLCQRWIPCFDERSFISYGEVKRHIIIVGGNIYVYLDITDPSPLYTIPLSGLAPEREDPNNPDFFSHTISPEANTGFRTPMFANRSKEALESVLLKDRKGNIAFQFAFDIKVSGADVLDRFVAAITSSEAEQK